MDRPSSRMEIVASMRRIRSECKSRKDKKNKVDITVSYEGVRVSLPSGKKQSNSVVTFSHPIHRYMINGTLKLAQLTFLSSEYSMYHMIRLIYMYSLTLPVKAASSSVSFSKQPNRYFTLTFEIIYLKGEQLKYFT